MKIENFHSENCFSIAGNACCFIITTNGIGKVNDIFSTQQAIEYLELKYNEKIDHVEGIYIE